MMTGFNHMEQYRLVYVFYNKTITEWLYIPSFGLVDDNRSVINDDV